MEEQSPTLKQMEFKGTIPLQVKRFYSTFSYEDATIFNSFIHDIGLIDLPMDGRHFTWVNKVGSKKSKLDCFLISNDVLHSKRCSTCKVFGHVLDECPKKIFSDVLKSLKTPRQAVRGVQFGSKLGSNQARLTRQEASTSNPFDALNTVENDDELGTNEGKSKLAEKGANYDVVSSAYGTSSKTFGSPITTPLAVRINDIER
ncbi:gag-aspartyl protease domain-containing protein [Tanacetum coccineum]